MYERYIIINYINYILVEPFTVYYLTLLLIPCAVEAYAKRGPCANSKTLTRVSAVVSI